MPTTTLDYLCTLLCTIIHNCFPFSLSSQGKLLYCHTPPGVTPETFNPVPTEARAPAAEGKGGSDRGVNSPSIDKDKGEGRSGGVTLSEFDKQFMEQVKTVSKTV